MEQAPRSPVMAWLAGQLELARGGQQQNLQPMEGLRGLAVFLVFLAHYVTQSSPWLDSASITAAIARMVHAAGNTGVDLFFVLSGYLIYGALLEREQAYRAFIWRRVVRIYPTFLAMLALYCLLSLVFPAENKFPQAPGDALAYLLANVLLLPGIFPITPIITVAWSLSYEFFYYLALPLFFLVTGFRKKAARTRVVTFVVIGVVAAVLLAWLGEYLRMLMFVAGILLFEAMKHRPHATAWTPWGWVALVLGVAIAASQLPAPVWSALGVIALSPLFALLCYACFSDPRGSLGRAFSWTPIRWLGNMSYSYYLLHGLVLKAMFMVLAMLLPPGSVPGTAMVLLALVPAFIATCIASFVLFALIERPFSLAAKVSPSSSTLRGPSEAILVKKSNT